MQRVWMRGSIVLANSAYSTRPTLLQGKSGRPFAFRADWTRQSRMTKTARCSVASVTSWVLRRA